MKLQKEILKTFDGSLSPHGAWKLLSQFNNNLIKSTKQGGGGRAELLICASGSCGGEISRRCNM